MSEQFRGKVEIQNSNGSGTAVVLDGNAKPQEGNFIFTDPDDQVLKSIGAGDHFITGQIDIRDTKGNIQLSLLPFAGSGDNKGSGWIKVYHGGILLVADKRRKKPGESDTAIQLNAVNGLIRIEGAAGETLAVPGMLRLVDGRLRLGSEENGDGKNAGSLRLRDAVGNTVILLDAANANLRIDHAQGETLTVPGMLRMIDGRLRLGGEPGTGGTHGSLRLRDANGKETIFLDGKRGDIILQNADCAEDFDVVDAEKVDPGTVMVLGEDGRLHPNHIAYDSKVAGVVSGADDYKPGLVLDKQTGVPNRLPIALMGKVFCKVDARYDPIKVGDLLTTSNTPGHAMRAQDPLQAFGAVLGKALRPLATGTGIIPILIALQ